MKKYVICLSLIAWASIVSAQDSYFVTVIKGAVTKVDGAVLKTGAKITLEEKLVFTNKESLVILLHPAKGRYIVSPANATASKSNKLILLVKDYLQIHAENVRLSSRSIDDSAPGPIETIQSHPLELSAPRRGRRRPTRSCGFLDPVHAGTSTASATSEKTATFVPIPSNVAPMGADVPGQILMGRSSSGRDYPVRVRARPLLRGHH